jgi:hypothetical protein
MKISKNGGGQPLCENVRKLRSRRHMKNTDITKSNSFPDEVEINFHMFGVLMLDWILGHVDGADIVTIHKSCLA